ncbi:hypothetical protein ACFXO2_09110 [Streptomyces sp. NPDC059152]|uniref:hypothetical protein n=1 Tax=Streptomyces sp. NPDC059152 TaxID=3346742 RepID=UPI0036BC9242
MTIELVTEPSSTRARKAAWNHAGSSRSVPLVVGDGVDAVGLDLEDLVGLRLGTGRAAPNRAVVRIGGVDAPGVRLLLCHRARLSVPTHLECRSKL